MSGYVYGRTDPRVALEVSRQQVADLQHRHDLNVARIRRLETENRILRTKAGRIRDINMGDLDTEIRLAVSRHPEPVAVKNTRLNLLGQANPIIRARNGR